MFIHKGAQQLEEGKLRDHRQLALFAMTSINVLNLCYVNGAWKNISYFKIVFGLCIISL